MFMLKILELLLKYMKESMTIPWKATKVSQIWQKYIPWYEVSLMQILDLNEQSRVIPSSPIKGAPLPPS